MADHASTTTSNGLVLPEGVYNTSKWIAQVLLPLLGTFYAGLAAFVPTLYNPIQVVGIISLVDLLLGGILGLSSIVYNSSGAGTSGTIVASTDPVTGVSTIHNLVQTVPTSAIANADTVTFKVVAPTTSNTITPPVSNVVTPTVGD